MLPELANGLGGSLEDFLVEQPFLEAEAFDTLFPIGGFFLQQLVERAAGGTGAMVIEGRSASLPAVACGESAQAMKGTAEHGRGFGEAARGRELEPSGEELVVGSGFIGLERPQWLRVES